MKPLVSVILPTYNVEKYLGECIESIREQTYQEIEIIIVIDGATDRSFEIAKKYEKKDDRIVVIYQENAGSGPARNNGLKHANGKYVMFIDPDDWVDTKIVETFVSLMEETDADLLTSRAINVLYDDSGQEIGRVRNRCKQRFFETEKVSRENYFILYNEHLLGAPTKKLYRMQLIKDFGVEFPDLRRSQDIVFNYRYYEHVKKVYVSDETLYYYRINKFANVLKLPYDYFKTVILIHEGILEMYHQWGIQPTNEEMLGYNNIFLDRIERCLEARKLSRESSTDILNNLVVTNIVMQARPKRMDKVIVRFLILNKQEKIVYRLIGFKRWLRKVKGL